MFLLSPPASAAVISQPTHRLVTSYESESTGHAWWTHCPLHWPITASAVRTESLVPPTPSPTRHCILRLRQSLSALIKKAYVIFQTILNDEYTVLAAFKITDHCLINQSINQLAGVQWTNTLISLTEMQYTGGSKNRNPRNPSTKIYEIHCVLSIKIHPLQQNPLIWSENYLNPT